MIHNYDEIIFINGIMEHSSFCERTDTVQLHAVSSSIIQHNLYVLLLYRHVFDSGQSLK